MDFPPKRRVEGARALALAFVIQAETLTRIRHLTMPGYRRLSMDRLHSIVIQVHALCRDTAWDIENALFGETPMPENDRKKYAPLKNHFWTSQGSNGKDDPLIVGIFPNKADAHRWCDRQNEAQHDEEWGRGSAGPMHFVPKPLYAEGPGSGHPTPSRSYSPSGPGTARTTPMPISSRSDNHREEKSLYAPLIEYATMILALDHFFREVVEGNVPLTSDPDGSEWWQRRILPERVNAYSRNWCVLFESLAQLRERIEEQGIYANQISIDANLNFTYASRRGRDPEPITWEAND